MSQSQGVLASGSANALCSLSCFMLCFLWSWYTPLPYVKKWMCMSCDFWLLVNLLYLVSVFYHRSAAVLGCSIARGWIQLMWVVMLVAAGLCLRCSGSFLYARWVSISLCVYCMYACVCIWVNAPSWQGRWILSWVNRNESGSQALPTYCIICYGRALRWFQWIVLDIMVWKCGKCWNSTCLWSSCTNDKDRCSIESHIRSWVKLFEIVEIWCSICVKLLNVCFVCCVLLIRLICLCCFISMSGGI
jgi:hypothetical protein